MNNQTFRVFLNPGISTSTEPLTFNIWNMPDFNIIQIHEAFKCLIHFINPCSRFVSFRLKMVMIHTSPSIAAVKPPDSPSPK